MPGRSMNGPSCAFQGAFFTSGPLFAPLAPRGSGPLRQKAAAMRVRSMIPLAMTTLLLAACGGASDAPPAAGTAAPATGSDLTPWQVANGVGPITEASVLEAMDRDDMAKGKARF